MQNRHSHITVFGHEVCLDNTNCNQIIKHYVIKMIQISMSHRGRHNFQIYLNNSGIFKIS